MASKSTSRALQSVARRWQQGCTCSSSTSAASVGIASRRRNFSVSTSRPDDAGYEMDHMDRPRWAYTPESMKAPFPVKPRNPEMAWESNNDPARLDQFYVKFLGRGGDSVLSEEVKWLAITHKSFDQGRRGFNDRLAFFGRRILNLQVTLSLLHSPLASTASLTSTSAKSTTTILEEHDPSNTTSSLEDDRTPFKHPSLTGLAHLSTLPPSSILTKKRIASLATQLGAREILRWKPRLPQNLDHSGIDVVLTTTVYAIIGAVALQRGSEVAGRVARERVLKPLGVV